VRLKRKIQVASSSVFDFYMDAKVHIQMPLNTGLVPTRTTGYDAPELTLLTSVLEGPNVHWQKFTLNGDIEQ
jgi:hypothetical protein